MRVLIVKTSSLGDLIHTLPAVTDAARARPGIRFDWVAEEAFAEIPGWHPAVENTLPIALRRWRKNWRGTLARGEIGAFWRCLREREYDLVIDAQGLLAKSAWLALCAHGTSHGLSWSSAREPLASLCYRHRHLIARQQHAIDRVRQLFAAALGYHYDASQLDYGVDAARFEPPVADGDFLVFLHGTSWPSKRLAAEQWVRLGELAAAQGRRVYLPWGSAEEKHTAEAIAAQCPSAQVLPRLNLTQLAGLLARSRGVIGVDTGLAHLAAALGTPGVTIYTATAPGLTGARGKRQACLVIGRPGGSPAPAVAHSHVRQTESFDAEAVWTALAQA